MGAGEDPQGGQPRGEDTPCLRASDQHACMHVRHPSLPALRVHLAFKAQGHCLQWQLCFAVMAMPMPAWPFLMVWLRVPVCVPPHAGRDLMACRGGLQAKIIFHLLHAGSPFTDCIQAEIFFTDCMQAEIFFHLLLDDPGAPRGPQAGEGEQDGPAQWGLLQFMSHIQVREGRGRAVWHEHCGAETGGVGLSLREAGG